MEEVVRVLCVDPLDSIRSVLSDPSVRDFSWSHCVSVEQTPTTGEDNPVDVCLTVLDPADSSGLAEAARRLMHDPSGMGWLVVVPAEAAGDAESVFAAGADDCLVAPFDAGTLRRSILRLLNLRRLAAHNRFLHETIRIMEDCRSLAHCLEPGQLYPLALEILLRATGRERGFTLFLRDSPEQGPAVAVRGFSDSKTAQIVNGLIDGQYTLPEGFEGMDVVRQGPLHEALRFAEIDASSLLVVSMGAEATMSGIVVLFDEGRSFTERDIEKADIVNRHSISALANAEVYSSAKERAFVDDVTEAYNVRYLLNTCRNEIRRSDRYGVPLSLLFLDLDRFKHVNDEFGHLVGSETLRRLCRLIEGNVRQVDTLARYGGDEFTILLVDTDHAAALVIAERIRRSVEAESFEVGGGRRVSLTVSIGVGTYGLNATDRDSLIDTADKAMYRAKSLGRNRICSATQIA